MTSDITCTFGVRISLSLLKTRVRSAPGARAFAGTELAFPRPVTIEQNVKFWVDVFAAHSESDFTIHDRDHVDSRLPDHRRKRRYGWGQQCPIPALKALPEFEAQARSGIMNAGPADIQNPIYLTG